MTNQQQSRRRPHFRVIKGGQWYKRNRNKNKKRRDKRFWADACVKTLEYMQQAARLINAAFHHERHTPGYHVLHRSLMKVEQTKEESITLVEKELILYKNFALLEALAFAQHGEILAKGEEEFRVLIKIREQENRDHLLGLRIIAQRIMIYVHTPDFRLRIKIRSTLASFGEKPFVELFDHMTVRLRTKQHDHEQQR